MAFIPGKIIKKKERLVMSEKSRKVCPRCKGEKVAEGDCVCNSEWRGTQITDNMDDCQCNAPEECPVCLGTGFVTESE